MATNAQQCSLDLQLIRRQLGAPLAMGRFLHLAIRITEAGFEFATMGRASWLHPTGHSRVAAGRTSRTAG
jgi:hypothetical protein